MKTNLWKLLAVVAVVSLSAVTPPLPTILQPTHSVVISWDYPTDELADVSFVIKSSESLATNAVWSVVASVTNSTQAIVTATFDRAQFFTVTTHSAFWDMDAPPSDPVVAPALPRVAPASIRKR